MFKIKHLHHTADVRLKIEADTLEALFQGGTSAINAILKPGFCHSNRTGAEIRRTIQVQSVDTTTLLIDFLSELLTLSCSEHAVFCEIEIEELRECHIKAMAVGCKVPFHDEDIKAVTYHEAEVRRNRLGNFETLLVFDI